MKYYDYNGTLQLALVSDDDGFNVRYEKIDEPTGTVLPLEQLDMVYLRQRHYVANTIVYGLYIVGKRIEIVPADWARNAGVVKPL